MRQKNRSWGKEDLEHAVRQSKSIRNVISLLGLKPAGGNYVQIKKYIDLYHLDCSHFTGSAWNKGLKGVGNERLALTEILVKNSNYQSYKLKKRLFKNGTKIPKCELCGWRGKAIDGRVPVELDHVNGDRRDNRIENLRILCPNCHSLQPTHRGLNKKRRNAAVV